MTQARIRLPNASRAERVRRSPFNCALLMFWVMPLVVSVHAKNRFEPALYEVDLNREAKGVRLFLQEANGDLWIPADTLKEWRLKPPPAAPVRYHDDNYYRLQAYADLTLTVDQPRLKLAISARPDSFLPTVVGERGKSTQATPAGLGGYVNYDVVATGTRRDNNFSHQLSGALLFTAFYRDWNINSNFVLRDVTHDFTLLRLETNWQRDDPAKTMRLTVGDAISRPGIWGRSLRFGGISYATNFTTRPDLITFPLPTLRGEAAIPSAVDVFVNDQRRSTIRVPPGPFELTNVPTLTGAGELSLVTRDILGREQIVTIPFYVAPVLLKPGLTEQSYEIGVTRRNYGLESNDYATLFASSTLRAGFTDSLTGEVRAELTRDQQTLGVGGSWLVSRLGVVTAAAAASHSDRGTGGLFFAGLERIGKPISFGVRGLWTTPDFVQLGFINGQAAPARVFSGNVGVSFGKLGSFGTAFARRDERGMPPQKNLTANYSVPVGPRSTIVLLWTRSESDNQTKTFAGLTYVQALDNRLTANVLINREDDRYKWVASLRQNPPVGEGTAWRVLAGNTPSQRFDAGATYQSRYGSYSLDGSISADAQSYRAQASGSLIAIDGRYLLSRRIGESFGLVQLPGYPDVRIYAENQVIARTDAQGYALLPRLRPYQRNQIGFDPTDLPLDAEFSETKREAVPYARSGMVLRFPVRAAHGVLLRVVLEDGNPLPAGASLFEGEREFPVGHRGEAFVTGVGTHAKLRAEWRNQGCEFEITLPPERIPLPEIGPILCRGVRR